jgi:hypothetical protein
MKILKRIKKAGMKAFGTLVALAVMVSPLSVSAHSSEPADTGETATVIAASEESSSAADTKESTAAASTTIEAEETKDPSPFVSEGNATLVSESTDADEKEFYEIKTPSDNTFYLIIDKQGTGENVYMTSLVTEEELLSLVKEEEKSGTASFGSSTETADEAGLFGSTEASAEEDTEAKADAQTGIGSQPAANAAGKASNGNTMIILMLVLMAGAFGVLYYVKIVKGRTHFDSDLDFDDDEDFTETENKDAEEGSGDRNTEDPETEDPQTEDSDAPDGGAETEETKEMEQHA